MIWNFWYIGLTYLMVFLTKRRYIGPVMHLFFSGFHRGKDCELGKGKKKTLIAKIM